MPTLLCVLHFFSANLFCIRTDFCLWTFFSENLDRAKKRTEELALKLEQSEQACEKAERDAATVEDLRQRLHKAANALSGKVSQQIARENAVIDRLETLNRRFVSKCFPSPAFVLLLLASPNIEELPLCSSREDG
jgi:hypothetical protein